MVLRRQGRPRGGLASWRRPEDAGGAPRGGSAQTSAMHIRGGRPRYVGGRPWRFAVSDRGFDRPAGENPARRRVLTTVASGPDYRPSGRRVFVDRGQSYRIDGEPRRPERGPRRRRGDAVCGSGWMCRWRRRDRRTGTACRPTRTEPNTRGIAVNRGASPGRCRRAGSPGRRRVRWRPPRQGAPRSRRLGRDIAAGRWLRRARRAECPR